MDPGHLVILITAFGLAIFLFLFVLDLICCFGFNAGLMRFCCGTSSSSGGQDLNHDEPANRDDGCFCNCFSSSAGRAHRSGSGSSIQKEDLEDRDSRSGLTGGTNGHHRDQYHHVPPHVQARGDAV